jgi:hypothetical protein
MSSSLTVRCWHVVSLCQMPRYPDTAWLQRILASAAYQSRFGVVQYEPKLHLVISIVCSSKLVPRAYYGEPHLYRDATGMSRVWGIVLTISTRSRSPRGKQESAEAQEQSAWIMT